MNGIDAQAEAIRSVLHAFANAACLGAALGLATVSVVALWGAWLRSRGK